jgi:MYXO-CTERM domain-containing protein
MFARLVAASALVLASSSASAAVLVTQSVSFSSIAPFGTYTDGQAVAGGWRHNGNPVAFPFTNPLDIESVHLYFESTDAHYQAQSGPTPPPGGQPANTYPQGGVPWVEVNFLDPQRVGIVSLGKNSAGATLFEYGDPQDRFRITTELLADVANGGVNAGHLGLRMGGYVAFYDSVTHQNVSTDDFTFGGESTLTITVIGNASPTPEPAGLAALSLAGAILRRRR